MNITVYCGATDVTETAYNQAAEELGAWIGKSGHRLIYGGGRFGLMGILGRSVLRNGGEVIGISPEFIGEKEPLLTEITELILVEKMSERREMMIERGDAYIALPGGSGTLDEITEVIALARLEQLSAPIIFYNTNRFYEPLRELFLQMVRTGFYSQKNLDQIHYVANVSELEDLLSRYQTQKS